MPRKRLIWQLFPSYLLVTLLSLVALTWYATASWRQFYLDADRSGPENPGPAGARLPPGEIRRRRKRRHRPSSARTWAG